MTKCSVGLFAAIWGIFAWGVSLLAEEVPIDRLFWEEIAGISTEETLSAENDSDPRFLDAATKLLDRLERNVPELRLAAGASPEAAAFFENPAENFGRVYAFEGSVEAIQETELAGHKLFLLNLREKSGRLLAVFSPTIPEAWRDGKKPSDEETGVGCGVCFWLAPKGESGERRATLFAQRVGYHDETRFPGSLGIDLSLWDGLTVQSIASLEKITDSVQKKEAMRNFRLTERDIRPFYELLAASARDREGKIAQAARNAAPGGFPTAVDLFNRPEKCVGQAVELTGTIRRARRVPVTDRSVRARFGIDHYYELYLFTDDSQGYPLVFCVPELPDGASEGLGEDFRRWGTVAGLFYKPWAYSIAPNDSSGIGNNDTAEPNLSDRSAWIAVPLLVGRVTQFEAADAGASESVMSPITRSVLVGFFLLGLLLLFYLFMRPKRGPIEFRVGQE